MKSELKKFPEMCSRLFIKKRLSNSFKKKTGTELTYVLNEYYTSSFRKIFEDLESNMESLSIASFGVSLSTLEDVFMK